MIKKFIGILLLFVLSIQIIPVVQVGGLLCNNQINEELQHNSDAGNNHHDCIKKFSGKNDFLNIEPTSYHFPLSDDKRFFLHLTDEIPVNHSMDVHVPPPDC